MPLRFQYDLAGRLLSRIDPLGGIQAWQYDQLGRLVAQSDELNRLSTWTHNVGSQVVQATDPLGHSTTFEYDAEGRQIRTALPDPDGPGELAAPTHSVAYDRLGRVVSQTDERGGISTFAYDLGNNLVGLTDPAGNTTRFEYDRLDRQIAEVNPLGATRTWSYNARGHLLAYTDRNGRRTQWAYDPLGRTTSEQWLTGETLVQTIGSTYDANSRVTLAQDAVSRYSYTYNQTDQVTKVTSANANAPVVDLLNTYDLLGRKTDVKATVAGKADFRTTYAYDDLSRMTRITQQQQVSTNPVLAKRVDSAYTAAGERQQVTRFADVAGTRQVATSQWRYDGGGRLVELTHRQSTTSPALNSYQWTYDALGRPIRETSIDGVSTWSYDNASQVTAAQHARQTAEAFVYDATGNRVTASHSGGTQASIVTGANNRLLEDGRYRYEYDAEGNRTQRTELSTGAVQQLTWDHRNRLTAVTSRTAEGTVTRQVTYTYDLYDRRISRAEDTDGNGTIDLQQRYVHDGSDLILAFTGSTNRLTNRYLHGPGVDEILADEQISQTGAAAVTWSLGDRLGSIRDLVRHNLATNQTTVVNHLEYDTFGQIVGQSNSTQTPLFAYTGREWDSTTSLYHDRARWYDPTAGRFLSEDPLGFAAGDVNLNRYVGNGATLWVDPSGMQGLTPSATRDCMSAGLMAPLQWAHANGKSPGTSQNVDNAVFVQVLADRTWSDWWHSVPADVIGMVTYDRRDEYGKEMAEQIARKMRIASGLKEVRGHIEAGTIAANVIVQMASDPLDMIVTVHGACVDPSWHNLGTVVVAAVPLIPGSPLARKADDAVDLGKAGEMARKEAEALGRAPLPASTQTTLTGAAGPAHTTVGTGRGPVHGTKTRTAFVAEVRALGNANLTTEVSYLNGRVVPRGTPGSVRLDVVEGPLTAPMTIYDLKTGSATLTPARIQQIQQHIPGGANVPVIEIR